MLKVQNPFPPSLKIVNLEKNGTNLVSNVTPVPSKINDMPITFSTLSPDEKLASVKRKRTLPTCKILKRQKTYVRVSTDILDESAVNPPEHPGGRRRLGPS